MSRRIRLECTPQVDHVHRLAAPVADDHRPVPDPVVQRRTGPLGAVLVGEAQPPSGDSDILPVSVNSPMGEALMKARIGETIRVKAPRGTMEFRILEIM